MAHFHPGVERWRELVEKLLPEDSPLSVNIVMAMIEQESSGYEFAQSPAGAKGLMQLMKGAAQDAGEDPKTFDWYDPEANVKAGIEYMSQMMRRFKGDLRLSLAAYNSGPTRVARLGAVPPIRETQRYVERISARVKWLDNRPVPKEPRLVIAAEKKTNGKSAKKGKKGIFSRKEDV